MEALRQLTLVIKRVHSESEHAGFDFELEEVVAGLIGDYQLHRERIVAYTAPASPSGHGGRGLPEPSGVTPLMSP